MRYSSLALCALPALATAQQVTEAATAGTGTTGEDIESLYNGLPASVQSLLIHVSPSVIAASILADVSAGSLPNWIATLDASGKEAFGLGAFISSTPTPVASVSSAAGAGFTGQSSVSSSPVTYGDISSYGNASASASATGTGAAVPGAVGDLGGLMTIAVLGVAGVLGMALL